MDVSHSRKEDNNGLRASDPSFDSEPVPQSVTSKNLMSIAGYRISDGIKRTTDSYYRNCVKERRKAATPFNRENTCKECSRPLRSKIFQKPDQKTTKYRHHCRRCGHSFCAAHCSNRIPLPEFGFVYPVRVCAKCYGEVQVREENPKNKIGVIVSGFLKKKGIISHGWKERYVVVTNAAIHYFKKPKHSQLLVGEERGCIMLSEIVAVKACGDNNDEFEVRTKGGRSYQFLTPNAAECEHWLDKIESAKQSTIESFDKMTDAKDAELCISLLTATCSDKERIIARNVMNGEVVNCVVSRGTWLHFFVPSGASYKLQVDKIDISPQSIWLDAEGSEAEQQIVVSATRIDEPTIKCFGINAVGLVLIASGVLLFCMDFFAEGLVFWTFGTIFTFSEWSKYSNQRKKLRLELSFAPPGEGSVHIDADSIVQDAKTVDILNRFMIGANNNKQEALKRYQNCLQWRKQKGVDNILTEPQPYFDIIKKYYPHYIHKRSRSGHIVFIEAAGSMSTGLHDLQGAGVPLVGLFRHYIFLQEYIWTILEPRPLPQGRVLKVLDMKGMSMRDVSSPVVDFMKTMAGYIGPNYPERTQCIFVVNVPSWFNIVWKLVSPMVNEVTKSRTKILRSNYQKELLEMVDPANLPVEYGGTCQCEGSCSRNSPEEIELRAYIEKLNDMQNVRCHASSDSEEEGVKTSVYDAAVTA